MGHAYRCPVRGLQVTEGPEDVQCAACGETHTPYETGAPTDTSLGAAIIPDSLPEHMDWALGERIASRSERRRKYAAAGLRVKSASEHRRQHGHDMNPLRTTAITYAGQKNHKSSAERGVVRTGTGQRVV